MTTTFLPYLIMTVAGFVLGAVAGVIFILTNYRIDSRHSEQLTSNDVMNIRYALNNWTKQLTLRRDSIYDRMLKYPEPELAAENDQLVKDLTSDIIRNQKLIEKFSN